jgi:VanZ family protein
LDLACLLLTLLALVLLLMPLVQNDRWTLWLNLAHVPGFAFLAWLWAEDLLARDWPARKRFSTVIVFGLLVAAITEGLQAFVPGRYADLSDMLRNALGIALGLGVHAWRPGLSWTARGGTKP